MWTVSSGPMDSVDYVDTFITVAPDSAATDGTAPPSRATPSVSELTYRRIHASPYALTSGDVIFGVWAERRGIAAEDLAAERDAFYAKGQPCLRSSDLGKRYGWGVHADGEGRIALYAFGSPEYERLAAGHDLDGRPVKVVAAMRSARR